MTVKRRSVFSAVLLAFGNTCPVCEQGRVFSGIIRMNEKCPHCGIVFEREGGYFTGAMSISYFISFFLVLPTFLPLLLSDRPFWIIVGVPIVEGILLCPLVFRYSRLI